MKLTEVMKLKVLFDKNQEALLHDIDIFQYNRVEQYTNHAELLDYSNDAVKKRAMTVGTAFNIAFKFLIAITHDNLDIGTVIEKSVFKEEAITMELGIQKLESEGHSLSSVFYGSLAMIKDLKKEDPELIQKVASYAVSLSWFKSYFESGFFPADVSVMYVSSQVHQDLTNEVYLLLKKSYYEFILGYILDSPEHIIIIEPKLSADDITYKPDFILDGTMIDIHTTANLKTGPANVKKLIGAYLLNKKHKTEVIEEFAIYYPRFSLLDRYTEDVQKFNEVIE